MNARRKKQNQKFVQFELLPGMGGGSKARPFVKWAGGKNQLLPELARRAPKKFNRYFEPFLGGGALLFYLQPKEAFVSDLNSELINLYEVVRDRLDDLIKSLKKHEHSEEYFYSLRNVDRELSYKRWGAVRRASRFLYLNKTCFNGLYRVNSLGQFNVPFGSYKNPNWVDEKNLRACSEVLQSVSTKVEPFERILSKVKKGDLVYFDPPYAPLTPTSNFTSYTSSGFTPDDQIRLSEFYKELDSKGAYLMLSNSSTPSVFDLYSDFNICEVKATRAINSCADKRGKVSEVIITNYEN